jgi:hypothetical protein
MMAKFTKFRVLVVLAAVAAASVVGVATAAPPDHAQSEHQRIVEFWTHARVAQAVPRDFVLDANGEFRIGPPAGRVRAVAVAVAATVTFGFDNGVLTVLDIGTNRDWSVAMRERGGSELLVVFSSEDWRVNFAVGRQDSTQVITVKAREDD